MVGWFSSKKVAENSNWKKAEREAAKSKIYDGYKVKTQKTFRSTRKRPDIFGGNKKNSRDRVVGEVKCVKELTKNHVDQLKGYVGHPAYAKKRVLHVCKDSKVPHKTRSYAKRSKIKIFRLKTKRKKGFFD